MTWLQTRQGKGDRHRSIRGRRHVGVRQAEVEASQAAVFNEDDSWKPCIEKVVSLGLTEEEAVESLKRAFGWSSQAYWRKTKVNESATLEQIEERVEKLYEAGMSEEDVALVVGTFPEVLGCEASLMEKNIEHIRATFFVRDAALVNVLKRKPGLLGNIIDCEGDCMGECNRCWARF